MSSPRSDSPTSPSPRLSTPCTENDIGQSMSPTSQSDLSSPIPSDAADYPPSDSSSAGDYRSRAPTPQCLPLDDIIPENDAISQEAMYNYADVLRSLIVDAQGRAATPCSDLNLNADPSSYPDVMMWDPAQSQLSRVIEGFDWPQASTMALDELPDSDLWYRSEYQLTQEWLEQTMQYLTENDEEKRVVEEREVDLRAGTLSVAEK